MARRGGRNGVTFTYRYQFKSGSYRYYGRPNPRGQDIPLEAWIIDHLNTSRRHLVLGMSNVRRKEEALIRRKSRVDTGTMRSMVTGSGNFAGDILSIRFGWDAGRPLYSPHQEFGTRRGIQPMMAVYDAYHDAIAEVKALLGKRR